MKMNFVAGSAEDPGVVAVGTEFAFNPIDNTNLTELWSELKRRVKSLANGCMILPTNTPRNRHVNSPRRLVSSAADQVANELPGTFENTYLLQVAPKTVAGL